MLGIKTICIFGILASMNICYSKTEGNKANRQLTYPEKMFLSGFKTGCFLGQIKVLPFEGIPAFAVADWDFCEAAYWEIHNNFDKFSGKKNDHSTKK